MTPMPAITCMSAEALSARLGEFADLLQACVHGGASVNFVLPFPGSEAEAFWRERVLPAMGAGTRTVLAAESDGRIAGSVQLSTETPPNQPHRADVTKLLVHPAFRRRGIGRALMLALEQEAHLRGRSLITLDTTTGGAAEPLYAALGYITVGVIPDFSVATTGDRLEATTVMYKQLSGQGRAA
jgi:ribosomal protein S18 acetylase RimI-like enzyme